MQFVGETRLTLCSAPDVQFSHLALHTIAKMASTPAPNPALHVTEDHRIYMDESPALNPGPNDCVVHVQANGICGYAAIRAFEWP